MLKSHEFSYDLDLTMQPANGILRFNETGTIESCIGDKAFLTLTADEVAEVLVIPGVGCGLICARLNDGSEVLLCRFTMSCMKEAGEFCKVVN